MNIAEEFPHADIFIPIEKPVAGMKVLIDGRTFKNYSQFDSGIAAPRYVALKSGLNYSDFIPKDSIVLNYH